MMQLTLKRLLKDLKELDTYPVRVLSQPEENDGSLWLALREDRHEARHIYHFLNASCQNKGAKVWVKQNEKWCRLLGLSASGDMILLEELVLNHG